MKLTYAMAFVSDMSESTAFYRDIIGLKPRFESSHWTEFETEGATLALHLGEGAPAPENAKQPGMCRPGFWVHDLDAFHQRMLDAQVPCLQAPRDLHGTRIAQYADPDGLVISVSGP